MNDSKYKSGSTTLKSTENGYSVQILSSTYGTDESWVNKNVQLHTLIKDLRMISWHLGAYTSYILYVMTEKEKNCICILC